MEQTSEFLMKFKNKVIVIVGQTAVGKSDLAVNLAKKFNAEIISADSRQVYKGLNIGTGKITKKEMCGIPHHLLDVANPKRKFTVAQYKKLADKKIKEIIKRKKLPIIIGGTGFYIQSIVNNVTYPEVPPNKALRKKLEKWHAHKLFEIIKKQDPRRANSIDPKNKIRLIRAIEIIKKIEKVPDLVVGQPSEEFLEIGLKIDDVELRERINKRLLARIKSGMIAEAKKLHENGLSWKRMEELGLEYKYLSKYLKNEINKTKMIEELGNNIWHYAKRQKTWFKRNKNIKWFDLAKKREEEEIYRLVNDFLLK